MFWYDHNASWWGYAGMAMTAAVVEGCGASRQR
jgi:hypothetical protein